MTHIQLKPTILLILAFLLVANSPVVAQQTVEAAPLMADTKKERPVIESLINRYAQYLAEGDSVSIAAMYASDGMMGCKRGDEILSSAGGWIRSGIKNDSRHVTFKTMTLNADGELLIETGTAEGRSGAGELKYSFRYLVVWKQEDGTWKLYRDIGL